jgi:hypothetical protein
MLTQLREHLQWHRPVETFSQSVIEAMGDRLQLTLDGAREIGAFQQVSAQQAIGVLITPACAGALMVPRVLFPSMR